MNECMAGNHKCEGKTTNCKNNFGSYSCECKDGFELGLSPYKCNGKMDIYFFYYSSLGHSGLKHSRADLNSSFIKRLLNVILSSCPIRIDWLRLPTFGRFFFLLYKLDTKEEEESISEKIEEKAVCIISKYGKLENKFSPSTFERKEIWF